MPPLSSQLSGTQHFWFSLTSSNIPVFSLYKKEQEPLSATIVPPPPLHDVSVSLPKAGFHLLLKYPVNKPTRIKRTIRTIAAIMIVLRDKPWALDGILKLMS